MIQEKLQRASFKGAYFYWRRLETQLGKKTVSHNYPGTARRFVEDMGTLPKIFTIEASISGAVDSDEYFQNKQALENALSSTGPGYLVHPTYGRVLATAKTATCTEESRSLNEARYSLTFEKSDEVSRPVGSTSTATQIENKRKQAIEEITETAAEEWTTPESPGVFEMNVSKVEDFSDSMSAVIGKVYAAQSDAFSVLSQITKLKSEAVSYISAPVSYFSAIASIYDSIMDMDDTYLSQFNRLVSFFGEGSDSAPGRDDCVGCQISAKSYETEEIEVNRVAQNEASNLIALVDAYSAISKIDFESTNQIDSLVNTVENQYLVMLSSGLMESPLRDTIMDMRIAAKDVVMQKRLLAQTIITADFKSEIPLNVALYMYAGDLDDENYILSLNADQDVVFASSGVELLQ